MGLVSIVVVMSNVPAEKLAKTGNAYHRIATTWDAKADNFAAKASALRISVIASAVVPGHSVAWGFVSIRAKE